MSAAIETRAISAAAVATDHTPTRRIVMNASNGALDRALDEVSASSAGGAPFLIAFGLTLFLTAIASFFLPLKVAAIVVMFQGNLALPLAFWLERRLGRGRMAADNPLRPLSVLMAMSQIVALPVVFLIYALSPTYVPAALAAVGGGHFLPYAWLQRTRVYSVLGVVVSVGAFALSLVLKRDAFAWVLFFMTACYWVATPWLLAHSRRLAARAEATA